jgi:predicted transcriptional regulator
MDAGNRYNSGYAQGGRDASSIINSLERGSNGQITESIKMVTSSMGAAYSRGMTQAIVDYIGVQNNAIDAYNNGLSKDNKGNYSDPSQVKQRLNVVFESTVDLDAFQANQIGADFNTNSNYFMKADEWGSNFIGGKNVPGSTEIGNSIMNHHHPSWAPTNKLPKGNMNPSSAKRPVENPTD